MARRCKEATASSDNNNNYNNNNNNKEEVKGELRLAPSFMSATRTEKRGPNLPDGKKKANKNRKNNSHDINHRISKDVLCKADESYSSIDDIEDVEDVEMQPGAVFEAGTSSTIPAIDNITTSLSHHQINTRTDSVPEESFSSAANLVVEAKLVGDDASLSSEDRQMIEEEIRDRIRKEELGEVTQAEVIMQDDKDDEEPTSCGGCGCSRKRKYICFVVMAAAIVAAVVIVAVLFANSGGSDWLATLGRPTIYHPNLTYYCEHAQSVQLNSNVVGSFVNVTTIDDVDDAHSGYGCSRTGTPSVWYEFTGTGESVALVTNISARISVFSGSCELPRCIATRYHRDTLFEDPEEGWGDWIFDSSLVDGSPYQVFESKRDSRYLIRVEKPLDGGAALNDFQLMVTSNGSCESAATFLFGIVDGASSGFLANDYFTSSDSVDNITIRDNCRGDGAPLPTPGKWYKVTGWDSGFVSAHTCSRGTTVQNIVTIYTGKNCGNLTCASNDHEIYSCSDPSYGVDQNPLAEEVYGHDPTCSNETVWYFLVQAATPEAIGTFLLEVKDS